LEPGRSLAEIVRRWTIPLELFPTLVSMASDPGWRCGSVGTVCQRLPTAWPLLLPRARHWPISPES